MHEYVNPRVMPHKQCPVGQLRVAHYETLPGNSKQKVALLIECSKEKAGGVLAAPAPTGDLQLIMPPGCSQACVHARNVSLRMLYPSTNVII